MIENNQRRAMAAAALMLTIGVLVGGGAWIALAQRAAHLPSQARFAAAVDR